MKHGKNRPFAFAVGVSPCFGEGSGLKRQTAPADATGERVSLASFGEGSGLKHILNRSIPVRGQQVSPCFGEGSGLKPAGTGDGRAGRVSPLASVRGAD